MTTRSLNSEQLRELETLVRQWAEDRKILLMGETMEVSVRVVSCPAVKIVFDQEPNKWDDRKVVELEFQYGALDALTSAVYTSGVVKSEEEFQNLTCGQLARVTREQMMIKRNMRCKTFVRKIQDRLIHLGYRIDWLPPKKSRSVR